MNDQEQRIMALEARIMRLEEVAMTQATQSGRVRTYHEPVDMDGYYGSLSQVLAHGNWARDQSNKINKACIRVGTSSAYCFDEVGQTGPLGVSKGVNGRFLSQVDSVPANTTVEVEA